MALDDMRFVRGTAPHAPTGVALGSQLLQKLGHSIPSRDGEQHFGFWRRSATGKRIVEWRAPGLDQKVVPEYAAQARNPLPSDQAREDPVARPHGVERP